MEVYYKCKCLDKEVAIQIPDRLPGTPIEAWVEMAMNNMGFDHSWRSPNCVSTTMEYAKIPADNPEGAGIPITKQ